MYVTISTMKKSVAVIPVIAGIYFWINIDGLGLGLKVNESMCCTRSDLCAQMKLRLLYNKNTKPFNDGKQKLKAYVDKGALESHCKQTRIGWTFEWNSLCSVEMIVEEDLHNSIFHSRALKWINIVISTKVSKSSSSSSPFKSSSSLVMSILIIESVFALLSGVIV